MSSRNAFGVAILAVLPMAACGTSGQPALDERDLGSRVDALATPEATAGRLSGIMVIARGDSVLVQRTWGFADWERRVPVSPSTRFGIASITKVMARTLVDQLTRDGRLDPSAAVAHYIPGFPDGPKGGRPTIRDLLTHRSGVPHRVTTEAEEAEHLHPVDIVDRVKAKGLLFEPGAEERYSSAGFTSLSRVVEVVEHQPFDDVLAERIFRPASMTSATGETGERLMLDRALPYRLATGAVSTVVASARYKNFGFLTGAGSLYMTAADLLHFVRALHDGTFGKVAQEQLDAPADTVWVSWYGRTNGYEGSVDYLPSQDVTFIFLSNLRSAANWQIRGQVRSILVGEAVGAIATVPEIAPSFEPDHEVLGAYGDPVDPVVIAKAEGRFFRDDSEFYPIAGKLYYIPASGATMRFGRDAGGRVDSLMTRFGSAPERAQRRVGVP